MSARVHAWRWHSWELVTDCSFYTGLTHYQKQNIFSWENLNIFDIPECKKSNFFMWKFNCRKQDFLPISSPVDETIFHVFFADTGKLTGYSPFPNQIAPLPISLAMKVLQQAAHLGSTQTTELRNLAQFPAAHGKIVSPQVHQGLPWTSRINSWNRDMLILHISLYNITSRVHVSRTANRTKARLN